MRGARAADAVAVAASVAAPTADIALGAVHEHPQTSWIRAKLEAIVRFLSE